MATKRRRSLSGGEHEHEVCLPKRPNVYDTIPDDSTNYAPTPILSHADYTIAWICALHLELSASRAMLDEEHESLAAHDGDNNAYVLGRIAKHNVVMTALPVVYGKVNAAAVSTHLKRTFPNIKAALMVGIGGGAPGEADLYLGDVVVGTRVMEYDPGKATSDGQFEHTAIPKHPSPFLLSAVTNLRSKHGMNQFSPHSQELMRTRLPRHLRPTQPDRLFQASYPHPSNAKTCDGCDVEKLQPRLRRLTEDFWIHYGVIASGDSVNKDAHKRDTISRRLQAKCFEMEAAGIMDSLECLPIRGICDYSDSHKNKDWQDYAAATAASYARELLETMPSLIACHVSSIVQGTATTSLSPDRGAELIDRRKRFLEILDFPRINARKDTIRAEQGKTCRWFLAHSKYRAWAALNSQEPCCNSLLWIRGKAGAGKSTLMKFLYSEVKKKQSEATVVSFFFNARGDYLEKSITGMYRSLLKQILTQMPQLQSILDQMKSSFTYELACPDLNGLKDLFKHAVMALGRRSLICFIDALDECNEDDVRDMVQFFEDLTESTRDEKIQFRVCFSSRPYPYIQVDEEVLLTLENEVGHVEDLAKYVGKCLKVPKKAKDDLQRQILEKASGVFMWVVLVVEILNKSNVLALRQRLSEIPPTLSQLFKDILTRDQERPDELRRCILWVLCACRPLTPSEFCHAMWAGGLKDGVVDDEIPDAEDDEVHMVLATSSSKGLVEVTNGTKKQSTVQFIHESVRDFLIKERGLQELWPDLGFEWEGPSHESLRSCCETYLMHPNVLAVIKGDRSTDVHANDSDKHDSPGNSPAAEATLNNLETPIAKAAPTTPNAFLKYASQHILDHANKAAPAVCQKEFLSRFFFHLGTKALDHCQPVKNRRYGITASPLYVLADKGLQCLVQLEAKAMHSIECDPFVRFRHPLFAAMANGHQETVAALLGLPSIIYEGENLMEGLGRKSDMARFAQRTPMSWAAQEGRVKLAKVLAENGESLFKKDSGEHTPLQRAAVDGQEGMIQFFIDKGVSVNDEDGARAIHYALVENKHGTVKILLQEFNAWGLISRNPHWGIGHVLWASGWLYWAARHGFEDVAKLCVQNGSQLMYGSNYSINEAAEFGHLNIVEFLADKGADLNAGSITAAAENGHLNIVKFLVDNGADLQSPSTYVAAARGHLRIVQFLADNGADLNCGSLTAAAENGHLNIVKFLVDNGADLNCGSLTAAAENGHLDIVKFLADNGADLEPYSIYMAAASGHLRVVQFLVDNGADLNCGSLRAAARLGHLNIVEFLADSGADLYSALITVAAANGHLNIVEFLVDRGGSVDTCVRSLGIPGKLTPVIAASRNGHEAVVKFLISVGADLSGTSDEGLTAYEYALQNGHDAVARQLADAALRVASR